MLLIGISRNAVCGSVGVVTAVELNNASSPRPRRLGSFSGGIVDFSLGISFHQFPRDTHVRFRANGADVVENDWLTEARCFGKSNISWDNVSEDLHAEIIACIICDLT